MSVVVQEVFKHRALVSRQRARIYETEHYHARKSSFYSITNLSGNRSTYFSYRYSRTIFLSSTLFVLKGGHFIKVVKLSLPFSQVHSGKAFICHAGLEILSVYASDFQNIERQVGDTYLKESTKTDYYTRNFTFSLLPFGINNARYEGNDQLLAKF